MEELGSYEKILNMTLKANNLTEIKNSNVPNSRKILNLPAQTATTSTPTDEDKSTAESQVMISRVANVKLKDHLKGQDLGLQITTSESQ